MITLTPKKIQKYLIDYDYEINLEQAEKILKLLDDNYETFTSEDIQEATDYIAMRKESVFAGYFE